VKIRGGRIAHQRIQYKPRRVKRGRKRKIKSWTIAPNRLTAKKYNAHGILKTVNIRRMVNP
jgi:hypothetical protein